MFVVAFNHSAPRTLKRAFQLDIYHVHQRRPEAFSCGARIAGVAGQPICISDLVACISLSTMQALIVGSVFQEVCHQGCLGGGVQQSGLPPF
jgi:hypothetical protein